MPHPATPERVAAEWVPARPLDRAALWEKFMTLTRRRYGADTGALFERLQDLEKATELAWVGA